MIIFKVSKVSYNVLPSQWLDEYQFLECLIQIICGTYDPEERHPPVLDTEEKASNESNEKLDTNHNSEPEKDGPGTGVG